ncbi:galactose-binding domain-like protein, partial [Cantharellus anzutake]|uniref:galactose-binding domain-like protein n=1 Tax=Cantharellus anzutake TaxID=1750568 RepID=UPI0019032561
SSDRLFRVSSTLDKSLSKKFLTDGNPETCWSSTQGTPQHVELAFENPVILRNLSLTFQGGFVGTRCAIYIKSGENATQDGNTTDARQWELVERYYPEDVNRKQIFPIQTQLEPKRSCEQLRIVFEQSSDFFGRVVVYDLDLDGDTLIES